ncbi:MAG: DNA polymerase III subunit delta' [Erythrobacter sp.]|jgi:DNA polymerase-3 subunit delta'|nr:DNA polymerase III subunit delta' [Erythrobacter sp.]
MTRWPNHADAWRQWREALSGDRMHHGWLLAGKAGLGKRDFALAAARELVAQDGIPQPQDHPDIHIVTYSAKDDKEERKRQDGKPFELSKVIRERDIGAMQARLRTRPTLGSRRAIIIEPADDMNQHAANKLLKSLEEPPAGTFFLLVTHRPARLLPTIRSRCRIMRFPALSDRQLATMLEEAGVSPDPDAIAAAEGSFGAALRFAEQDLAPIARIIEQMLQGGEEGFGQRGELARLIGPRADRERMQAVLELAQALTARAARESDGSARRLRLIDAHGALARLAAEAPTANFDAGILLFEIGGLLVGAAPASEPAHG